MRASPPALQTPAIGTKVEKKTLKKADGEARTFSPGRWFNWMNQPFFEASVVFSVASAAEATLKTELGAKNGWYIQLNQRAGEKILASPSAFFSVFFSSFVRVAGVCNAGGDARVYELNYETGGIPDAKAADPDGDGPESAPTVARDDRFIVIGKSIPTELTVTIQRAGSSGFVASSGNVDKLPLPELPNNVTPLSWRECSSGVPCRP